MPIALGSTVINRIMLGTTEIKKVYLGSTLIHDTTGTPATAPSAFTSGQWSIAPGDEEAAVTINSLPSNGGASITDIEYRLDAGSWVSSGGTGGFSITGLTNDQEYDVELRAVNSVGAGAASDTKQVTPAAGGSFHPLDLSPKVFINFADLSTLFAERTGSPPATPASVNGVVGSILNQGTAGGYFRAVSDSTRAILRTDGTRYWLEPDGSDDAYLLDVALSGTDFYVMAGVRWTTSGGGNPRLLTLGTSLDNDWNTSFTVAALLDISTGNIGQYYNSGARATIAIDGNDHVVLSEFSASGSLIKIDAGTPDTESFSFGPLASTRMALFANAADPGNGTGATGRLYALTSSDAALADEASLRAWTAGVMP